MNPNGNPATLKPFKPGQSGNPNGRPKGSRSWSSVIKELMQLEYDTPAKIKAFLPEGKYSAKEIAIVAMMLKSWKGDVQAVKWLSETEDGKPNQSIDTKITEVNKLPEGLTKADLMKLSNLNADK